MSKKAPDTRNKLDNNKGAKKKVHHKKKNSLKQFHNNKTKFNLEKKPTKGEIFKQERGFSKSAKRSMQKLGLPVSADSLPELKKARKLRKLKETKIRQEKHKASTAYKRANGKKKGSKGSTPASKTKK